MARPPIAGSGAVPGEAERCEVLIVGGGPAGATLAALLAERGRHIVLVEKERHPRFHIGESLLPLNLPLFERLGVARAVAGIGMVKRGVEFVSPRHRASTSFAFADALDKRHPHAYQVPRAQFDEILFRNAASKGAETVEGCRIGAIEFPAAGGVLAEGRAGGGERRRWHASFLVDASGRETLLARQLGWRERDRRHASAAVFGHFAGARRLPGPAEGHITIAWFDAGWFWFIPLADGTTSVGAVCRPDFIKAGAGDPDRLLMATIARCPEIAGRLAAARLLAPARATGNYSYGARHMGGERFLLIGDAFAFLDPVFSTGVFLAMRSAVLAAPAVEAALDGGRGASRARRRFEAEVRRGLAAFSWYIHRATSPALRDLFMAPRNDFRMAEAMLSLLAGDIAPRPGLALRLALFRAVWRLGSWRRPASAPLP